MPQGLEPPCEVIVRRGRWPDDLRIGAGPPDERKGPSRSGPPPQKGRACLLGSDLTDIDVELADQVTLECQRLAGIRRAASPAFHFAVKDVTELAERTELRPRGVTRTARCCGEEAQANSVHPLSAEPRISPDRLL